MGLRLEMGENVGHGVAVGRGLGVGRRVGVGRGVGIGGEGSSIRMQAQVARIRMKRMGWIGET